MYKYYIDKTILDKCQEIILAWQVRNKDYLKKQLFSWMNKLLIFSGHVGKEQKK